MSLQRSSPDITIVSSDLLTKNSWHADVSLSSDHLPITVQVNTENVFVTSDEMAFVTSERMIGRCLWGIQWKTSPPLTYEHCKQHKYLKHLEETELGTKKLWSTIESLFDTEASKKTSTSFEGHTPKSAFNSEFNENPPAQNQTKWIIKRTLHAPKPERDITHIDVLDTIKKC